MLEFSKENRQLSRRYEAPWNCARLSVTRNFSLDEPTPVLIRKSVLGSAVSCPGLQKMIKRLYCQLTS